MCFHGGLLEVRLWSGSQPACRTGHGQDPPGASPGAAGHAAETAHTAAVKQPADEDQEHAERQEAQIPAQRGSQVVPDVVEAEDLVVDQPLGKLEYTQV